ncbi:RICIN domain-containing protein [Aureimonas pseudogalii]|uniref:Ricin B lectin domain-containing protein n=1 Tax=Aureimonas pseudogalii TaxID=1744844 RepID=A0A7W6H668_9HYPH|nr:RICIN domain-containing protein [Aureimonas pseudogalii]MBB3999261.1 hypothetical protein [Aureimonas pseudogalii]
MKALRSAAAGALVSLGLSSAASAGSFEGPFEWNFIPIHAALLPDGKIMTFGATPTNGQGGFDFDIWDPTKGTGGNAHLKLPNLTDFNSFCVGAILQAGNMRLMIAGGNSNEKVADFGFKSPQSGLARMPSMKYPRYYASLVTLSDGRVLVHGGSPAYGNQTNASEITEIYTPGQNWTELPGTGNSPMRRGDQAATGNPFWYPHIYPVGNDEVFVIAGKYTYRLNYSGRGSVSDVKPFTGTNYGATSSGLMVRPGVVMQIGGGSHGNNTGDGHPGSDVATIFDLRNRPETRRDTKMAFKRHFPTATVLANGEVLVVGGSEGNNELQNVANTAELYNPDTDKWRTDATMRVARLYHSTAILMKDGRVLVGGGGAPGPVVGRNAEIYTPDYLLDAAGKPAVRPSILSGPVKIALGQPFQITTDKTVRRITIVKTGAVTHGYNTDQRFFEAAFRADGNNYTVTFPNDAVNATPGLYMVFAFDTAGVASVGKYVRLPSPLGDDGSDIPSDVPTSPASIGTANPGATPTTTPTTTPNSDPVPTGSVAGSPAAGSTTPIVASQSKLCLSIKGGSQGDGAELVQETCRSGASIQNWSWRAANGGFMLVNGQSNKCVDVYQSKTEDGAKLVQWPCWGGDNQVWKPVQTTSGLSLVSKATNKCLDVSNVSTASGAQVWQWNCHNGANQAWSASAPSANWQTCANEGQVCNFPGRKTVRYGLNGAYATRQAITSPRCDNATFGDPAPGSVKQCQVSN